MASDAVAIELSHIEHSSSMELMVESLFLSELLQEAWFGRGWLIDVLHSTVDAFGYDVVLQRGAVLRHVQLKARQMSGKTSKYKLSSQLAVQPAGCVICILWERDPTQPRMRLSYRWFGNGVGEPIPDLGDKLAKHSKGNAEGTKNERKNVRVVPLSRFTPPMDIADLLDRLFGEE